MKGPPSETLSRVSLQEEKYEEQTSEEAMIRAEEE